MHASGMLLVFLLVLNVPKDAFCLKKMLTIYGTPDPATTTAPMSSEALDWDSCVQKCYNDATCFVAYGTAAGQCSLYAYKGVTVINRPATTADRSDKISSRFLAYATDCDKTEAVMMMFKNDLDDGTNFFWMQNGNTYVLSKY